MIIPKPVGKESQFTKETTVNGQNWAVPTSKKLLFTSVPAVTSAGQF